ncbi:MAG TPA: tetratricopeptide repeat protein [Methylomirabilota bacterium]|nr:tetratricopeptide repeat protein [Methylomirabilota bacterium]
MITYSGPPAPDPGPRTEWVLSEREVIRLLDLAPKQVRQLKRLDLLRQDRKQVRFRELVGLRVAKGLLDAEISVRKIRRLLHDLERLLPESTSPLAELRVVVQGKEILVESGTALLEPGTGQAVLAFDVGELVRTAKASASRGLIRPLVPRASEADFWFEQAGKLEDDAATCEEAVTAYERALEIEPHYAAAWNNLGLLRHRMAQYDGATECYRRAFEEDPTLAQAVYNLGVIAEDIGDSLSAVFYYRKALEIDPDYADAHFNLASALEREGRRDEAKVHWREYVRLDPHSHWATIANRHLKEIEKR